MSKTAAVTMMKQRLKAAVENSALKSVSDAFARGLERSILKSSSDTFSRGFETSVLSTVCARIVEITKASWCYRWLTAEPEPDVIVIDLRETYTVGPFIAVLDAIAPRIARFWRNSGLASVAERLEQVLSASATIQLVAKLLEPPEPPENNDQRK
ncbi:hypothetical protein NDI54_11130 [Haloarcula sp. S1AR25-5A]|uniref:Uncharacterized protein n=1 Tax=Haloarcula terrestris TaxID=2950533 RepID=A0AAE4JJE5_9EURY|nr:hypothetical protein [Haloarcula terrestris]MDS0221901.1 hypothetical protein [Haloarcula terrestris]